uniref:Uncharacterized protein n=1 Tax=Paramormyrops kingsleyae TaxID=1676925 RepID=A0A3B3SL68_9TELE
FAGTNETNLCLSLSSADSPLMLPVVIPRSRSFNKSPFLPYFLTPIACFPARAYADGAYADTETYAYAFTNKPGQRIPKAGAKAAAGIGRAGAHWSIFEAEANGPNASASAEANVLGAGAMARAEVGSASASAGPVYVKAGLGVDTGVKIGPTEVEIKVLVCGHNTLPLNSSNPEQYCVIS